MSDYAAMIAAKRNCCI